MSPRSFGCHYPTLVPIDRSGSLCHQLDQRLFLYWDSLPRPHQHQELTEKIEQRNQQNERNAEREALEAEEKEMALAVQLAGARNARKLWNIAGNPTA